MIELENLLVVSTYTRDIIIQQQQQQQQTPSVGPAFTGSGEIQLQANLPLPVFLPTERLIP